MLQIENCGFEPKLNYQRELSIAIDKLKSGSGEGGEYTGWVYLPVRYDRDEFERIKTAAAKIKKTSDVLVVVGIGGSYLGARAVIDLLRSPNYNLLKKETPDIFFTGNTLSSDAIQETIDLIGDRDFSINVISKSGSTTEPAVAFRIFRDLLEKKYGRAAASERIYVTTDKARGALKSLADAEGWQNFVIPDEIGGRYSVLTAVGLLPIAVAGVDIDQLMLGAEKEMVRTMEDGIESPAAQYAVLRNELYQNGKKIEILGSFEPAFRYLAEWWKQLYGESEGKGCKGIFPASVEFTADLHSMGQYIQEGERTLFETIVTFTETRSKVFVPSDEKDGDGLNYLAGQELGFVSEQARRGTLLAHIDGGVPNLIIRVPARNEEEVGGLIYFFEFACGLSGYLLGVNPFNQPGVEAYKQNMFALLGKSGYEDRKSILEKRFS